MTMSCIMDWWRCQVVEVVVVAVAVAEENLLIWSGCFVHVVMTEGAMLTANVSLTYLEWLLRAGCDDRRSDADSQ